MQAPAAKAWELFWDLPRLSKCVPGCERIEAVNDREFKARVTQKVGPFQASLNLDLSIQEIDEEKRVILIGTGMDRLGNRLQLHHLTIELEPVSEGESQLSYTVDFTLYGKLASLGSSIIKRKAEEVRIEFTRRLTAELVGQN